MGNSISFIAQFFEPLIVFLSTPSVYLATETFTSAHFKRMFKYLKKGSMIFENYKINIKNLLHRISTCPFK